MGQEASGLCCCPSFQGATGLPGGVAGCLGRGGAQASHSLPQVRTHSHAPSLAPHPANSTELFLCSRPEVGPGHSLTLQAWPSSRAALWASAGFSITLPVCPEKSIATREFSETLRCNGEAVDSYDAGKQVQPRVGTAVGELCRPREGRQRTGKDPAAKHRTEHSASEGPLDEKWLWFFSRRGKKPSSSLDIRKLLVEATGSTHVVVHRVSNVN